MSTESFLDSYEVKTLADYQRDTERFEKVNDGYILPDLHLILRLDGRRYGSQWNKETDGYPFKQKIVDGFVAAARELMCSGLRVNYAYVHGDEVSLLLESSETSGLRRRAKLISTAASVAAIGFYDNFKSPLSFHNKLAELPAEKHIIDYFMWQRKVSARNFLTKSILSAFIEQGMTKKEANQKATGHTEEDTFELAKDLNVYPSDENTHLIRGVGLWWNQNGTNYEIMQSRFLPEDNLDYARFVHSRIDSFHYAPPQPGIKVPYRWTDQ